MADANNLCFKSHIAPHGNEDSLMLELRSYCAICSLVGMRIPISTAVPHGCNFHRLDVKSALLHTFIAQHDVYVVPPG